MYTQEKIYLPNRNCKNNYDTPLCVILMNIFFFNNFTDFKNVTLTIVM